jgi:hypothetical protein
MLKAKGLNLQSFISLAKLALPHNDTGSLVLEFIFAGKPDFPLGEAYFRAGEPPRTSEL